MHYHVSNDSLTELVCWFIRVQQGILLWGHSIKLCRSVLTIWKVCFVWNSSQKCLCSGSQQRFIRGAAEAFLVLLFLAKAGYLLQHNVYGDRSLYSYKDICWNLYHCFKCIFSVFSSQYTVKRCMLCSANVFYQIIKTGMYNRLFWSECYWITSVTFVSVMLKPVWRQI